MTMAGSLSDDYLPPSGSLPVEWSTSMQHCQSVESLAEWRSCDQVENGVPSTSPPYWDSDDGDDSGPKPSDLFVKYTWKIESFSQTSKRELKSEVFEVGGYKWYILVYPQGCDVCNHLSLFLCVANHDKLLPGWSYFAQFTITVLNKDPKKNKYSGSSADTLHRFWKKEHDWGWKKFMELTKVMDGFVVDDGSLTIKAQVQVIREKAHRPFRCLDCQYRREIIRVYLSNVEQTYAHFIQERRKKLQDLLNDKAKWSSFRAFWLGIDQATRRCMSRDKTDLILKVAVKHFFIEKEVASTLIMDSLYTGLKALESQSKIEKVRMSLLEKEEFPAPFIVIENDMFILADDVFLLLERAASELPHPPLPAKEEKGLPNRAKDGCSGEEFNKDSIIRDERRLTELGRRTLEIFVLAHIFSSKIEIAYQEAVALKRQEELIREEAAEQAENVTRERRTKKKQAKPRRNNRKGKDRGKSEKSVEMIDEKNQLPESPVERISDEFSSDKACPVNGETDPRGDVSDVCDGGDDDAEALEPDTEGRDTSSLSWDAETSEVHSRTEVIATEVQNGHMKKKSTSTDDSLSSCSTDSVPSVVVNTQFERNSSRNNKKKRTSNRGKKQRNKDTGTSSTHNRDQILYARGTCGATEPEHEGALKNQIQKSEPHVEKEEVAVTLGNILIDIDPVEEKLSSKSGAAVEPSPSSSEPSREPPSVSAKIDKVSTRGLTSSTSTTQTEKPVSLSLKSLQKPALPKPEALKHNFEATTSSTYSVSRPSSTPVILSQKRTVPLISSSQARPVLSRTLSSINCSDTKPSPFAQSFEPKSYRNAIVGIKSATNRSEFTPEPSSSSIYQPSTALSMSSNIGQTSLNMGFFGSHCQFNDNTSSSRQSQGVMPDEFPHLDIINDLLDEDQIVGRASISGYHHYHDDYSLNQQYAFPQDSCQFDLPEYYYDELSQMVSFVPFPGLSDLSVYGNGMDAILQNQWPIDGGDLSMMNFGNPVDVNGYGYGYQLPEYPTSGVNGYNMMYQPANGP